MAFSVQRAARRDDPTTSHAAARRAARFAHSHAGRILAVLREQSLCTAHDISQITGLTVVQIDRRLPELMAASLAKVATLHGCDLVQNGFRVWEPCDG